MSRRLMSLPAIVAAAIISVGMPPGAKAKTSPVKIGIVLMHGKGGSPAKHVLTLATGLEGKSFLLASLDMPWSGRRGYDASVSEAEQEVSSFEFPSPMIGGQAKSTHRG